jgi:uncharacterized Zn-finger protein
MSKITTKQYSRFVEEEVTVLHCEGCNMEFVLFAVLSNQEDYEIKGYVEQVSVAYCPYCGAECEL